VLSPGKWITDLHLILGYLVGLWINANAFRSIQLNQDPILESGHHGYATLPLERSRECVLRGARPAGLGFCPNLLSFGTPTPEIKTHPKLVELVRNK